MAAAEPKPSLVERLFADHRGALQTFFLRRIRAKADAADLAQEVYVRMLRMRDQQAIRKPVHYLYRAPGPQFLGCGPCGDVGCTLFCARPCKCLIVEKRSVRAIGGYRWQKKPDRKSTRLNSSHERRSRMPSSA